MKPPEMLKRFLRASLLNPRAVILGAAVFNVIWSWQFMTMPYASQKYMTPMILVSALGLLLDKAWSNLLAAVVAGYFVIGFVVWFFEISTGGVARLFSAEHLNLIAQIDRVFQLSVVLAAIILSCAASSILRRAARSHRLS